ncbi:MAG: DDE-type integrase/transposase/recombinase [Acidobacteria bacterium]|nr:DDE-type integrase/transposase/recombinase [Acidobacteriota bacterium]
MHLELRGRECVIEDRLPNGHLRLKDVALGESKSVAEVDLVDALFDGQLVLLGDSKITVVERNAAKLFIDDLNMLDDADPRKKEAKRRWAYVKAISSGNLTQLNSTTLTPLIGRVHNEIRDPNEAPHWRTVLYRWFKSYLEAGEDPRVLVPQFKKRGSTRRRFAKGRKSKNQNFSEKEFGLASEVADLVKDVINEEYLNPQRLSVQETWERLDARIAEINQLRAPDDQLPVPHKNSIYRIVSQLDGYEKDRARFGKRYADQKYRCNKQSPQPTRPLERAEIDHTKLDLFVVDEETRLPLGRPTMTSLVDRFSRELLGVNVGFDPPSYLSVMQCLHHAIKPKRYVKAEFPTVENEWEAYGIPELIVVDNGKEFRSRDFEDACLQLGIAVMYSPPYQPRFKAAVERFFGTQNKRLLHQQCGTTFSNIFERHGYDPLKTAVISFDKFMEMLHIWIVDIYHQSYHRGLKDIPAHAWRREIENYPPALPRRVEDLRLILGHIEHRVIGPSGVELFTLYYNCEELALLRRRPNREKEKFAVKYDPCDISTIYVYDRQTDKYIPVPALDQEYAKGLSLWQHKVIQSYAQRDAHGRVNMAALRRAKKKIQEIVEAEMAKRGKSGTRAKVARWQGVRQPNYDGHLDIQQEVESDERGKPQADVLINPEAAPFVGISAVQSAPDDEAQGENAQPAGVIDLASEVKKRPRRKSTPTVPKKTGVPDPKDSSSKAAGGFDSAVTTDDDLDTSGFDAGYNLPRRGTKHDRKAS